MRFKFVLNTEEYGSLVLNEEPGGWKDIQVMLKRSLEYHGIFYEVMAQLEFKCRSGKEYIDKVIDELGIDAVIGITIYISCATTSGTAFAPDYSIDYSDDYGSNIAGSGDPVFETLYEGVINLANYKQTSESTTVDLIQSDFVQKIINRFETKVNIDVNEDLDSNPVAAIAGSSYDLTIPSKVIIITTNFDTYSATDSVDLAPQDQVSFAIPAVPILDENGGGEIITVPYLNHTANGSIFNTQSIYTNNTEGIQLINLTYSFEGYLKFRSNFDATMSFALLLQYGDDTFVNSTAGNLLFYPSVVFVAGVPTQINISVSGSTSFYLGPGTKIFLTGYFQVNEEDDGITFEYLESDFSTFIFQINNRSVFDETTATAYPIHELGAMIAQRITGLDDPLRSTLLGRVNSLPVSYANNGCASFVSLSNGKKIRKMPYDISNMFISMSDFYKFVNSAWNTGLGIEGLGANVKLVLEGKPFFYSTDVILQCPKASNIKRSPAKEYYTSDIIIGYERWENEEVNGIDEVNSKREYNTGLKSIDSKKEFLSPVIASPYSIEFTRRKQYILDPTLDYKYDNDNFAFCLKRTVDGNNIPTQFNSVEKSENYDTVNNIISSETTYNLRVTPARNLLRHLPSISPSLLKRPGGVIKFTYGEGNYLAETKFTADSCPGNFNNELLKENQDIIWDQAGEPPIWIPEYIEFDYPISFSEYLTLKNNPTKSIEVSEGSSDFMKGFIVSVFYKPVGGIATFKLLKAYVN